MILDDYNVIILAKSAPPITTETVLYQVPPGSRAFCRIISIAHRSGNPAESCRLSVSKNGVATAVQDYILFDHVLPGNDTQFFDLFFTMQALDEMRIYASAADITFILTGCVI